MEQNNYADAVTTPGEPPPAIPSGARFPATLKVADLRRHNPEYDADELERFNALYSAGKTFRRNVDKFLVKRPIEKMTLPGAKGSEHYERRKEQAWYIPRGAGLLDWLTAATFRTEPRIVAKSDPDGYWASLNSNADGLGTDFPALMRLTLNDAFLVGRAAIAARFDAAVGQAANPSSLAARMVRIPAISIDDWDRDENGRFEWVRTYYKRPVRSVPYLPADASKEFWAYYYPDATYLYSYTPDPNKGESDADAVLSVIPHDFGVLPVFPLTVPPNMAVMSRVYDILVALFNREVSITYGLNDLAYALLTFELSSTDLKNVVDATIGALKLTTGEKAQYVAPPPNFTEPLFKDCDRLKASLYEVIQAMSINAAATQTQNARQSAAAKTLDRDPLQTLLESYTWPVLDAVEQWIDAVKRYRGEEDNEVTVEGLDRFDATLDDVKEQIGLSADGKAQPVTEEVQALALNGAQVTALQQIVQAVSERTLAPQAAREMIQVSFPAVDQSTINSMIAAAAAFKTSAPAKIQTSAVERNTQETDEDDDTE